MIYLMFTCILSILFTSVSIDKTIQNSFIIPRLPGNLTIDGSLADKVSIIQPLLRM